MPTSTSVAQEDRESIRPPMMPWDELETKLDFTAPIAIFDILFHISNKKERKGYDLY